MKGRGTRKHAFVFGDQRIEKEAFFLFDFFANCEYFEEKFDYDEVLALPRAGAVTDGTGVDGPIPKIDEIDLARADKVISQDEHVIGTDGMRIDRELYFKKFEEKIQRNETAKAIYEEQGIEGVIEYAKQEILDKPTEFFTPDKLRRSLPIDRWVSFKEMMQKAFGEIDRIKPLDEKTDDEFDKFQDIEKLDASIVPAAKTFFSSYLQDRDFREVIDRGEYGRLPAMAGVDIQVFQTLAASKRGNEKTYVQYIPTYVKDYVGNLKEFERV